MSRLHRYLLIAAALLILQPTLAAVRASDKDSDSASDKVADATTTHQHWAYEPPQRRGLPKVVRAEWPNNAIDHWTLARMDAAGLSPALPASKEVLLRRVTLSLTGLPPTPAEREAFLADTSPDAYERVVDRLLASPRYGERMATPWLDLARYADTHGYHSDSERDMWRWRDWVIDALNSNMPYDQFTKWQLAGDLLPGATLEQRLATGLHRNHMLMDEEGSIPEEFLAEYIADRVAVTGTIWLAQTLACARCHDHKHDPISQQEYYELAAFFSQVPENGLGGRRGNSPPMMTAPTRVQQQAIDQISNEIRTSQARLKLIASQSREAQKTWEKTAIAATLAAPREPDGLVLYLPLDETEGNVARSAIAELPSAKITGQPTWIEGRVGSAALLDGRTYFDVDDVVKIDPLKGFSIVASIFPTTSDRLTIASRVDLAEHARGWRLLLDDGHLAFQATHREGSDELIVRSKEPLPLRRWHQVALTTSSSAEGVVVALFLEGNLLESETTVRSLRGHIDVDKPLAIAHRAKDEAFRGLLDDVRIYNRTLQPAELQSLSGARPIERLLTKPAADRTPDDEQLLENYFLEHELAEYRTQLARLRQLTSQRDQIERSAPSVMVMSHLSNRRPTFVHSGGQYDKLAREVKPAFPAFSAGNSRLSAPLKTALSQDYTRLDLANWLVDPANPLTARVAVNRGWQLFFGTGLVKTVDDFGLHGESPSHPELLDELALDFIASGWDVKALHRRIVTSSTYRQSSAASVASLQIDPANRLLSHFPRIRLPAEAIRDQALAAADLLQAEQGGVGVKPYLPADLWRELAYDPLQYSAQQYAESSGSDLYRRSVYLFIKRSAAYPPLLLFDATSRETCTALRDVTRTPLQALVLMNDTAFVEAARELAAASYYAASTSESRIDAMFVRTLSRRPTIAERSILLKLFAEQMNHFSANLASAEALLEVGSKPVDRRISVAEMASWTVVASAILNLDETQRPR